MNEPAGRLRWRWWYWPVIAAVVLFPIPRGEGLWFPLIFLFFDWLNQFLPENF